MKEKKQVKTEAGFSVTAIVKSIVGHCKMTNAKVATIACAGVIFAALVADNIYLHVEVSRQAQVVLTHTEQISDLCEWVERASTKDKSKSARESVAEFGHRIAEKIRATGRKTVNAIRKVDDKLNPQADVK